MLRSIKKLYGHKISATDGEIGHIKDFYFDDHNWGVRYVIVDTGGWLSHRQVLISPHAFVSLPDGDGSLVANLTREKIENSPSIDTHKPVSRQHEEDIYQYYGWPIYWQGPEMWGLSAYPMVPPIVGTIPNGIQPSHKTVRGKDAHLRSAKAVAGYQIETGDEGIGSVVDFMIQDKTWAIRHFVVETGHWFAGKKVLISTRQIGRISWEDSKVFVKLSKQAILNAPEYAPARPATTQEEDEVFLFNYL